MRSIVCLIALAAFLRGSEALDNGLARTPPMGWLTWERFRCITDCEAEPDDCISEKLMKDMADWMVSGGYRDAGYEYVIIDDCWLEKERDADGKLVADRVRFPNGIKNLAKYIHEKGLKFGIYQDYGTMTCAGFPGLVGHLEIDANTLASWDIDYVKVDGCYVDPTKMDEGYPEFGKYLKNTGRDIVYSCEWPLYQHQVNITPNYTAVAEHCNLWRNFGDVQDSWESITSILNFFVKNEKLVTSVAGPGGWNDPDMLVIGNFGLSYEQSKAQMALWAILASPLLMSTDLRSIRKEHKDILLNKAIIAVNQDSLGMQGKQIMNVNKVEIWSRPITPMKDKNYSYALVFLNQNVDGTPSNVNYKLKDLGLTAASGYRIIDLYTNQQYKASKPEDTLAIKVNPTGVVMVKAELI